MQVSDVIGLIGGLALFLYGMKMMSDGLELLAGSKLKSILEKITRNKYLGMLVGAGIAAVIQSSNATIVMTCSFVNAGLMSLRQAVGVIIGAKIGTTMTGQLLTLKIDQFAPIIAMIGVIMIMFLKKKFINHLGQVIAGLGILFLGMSTMSGSMAGLKTVPEVAQFLSFIANNPLLGVLVGMAFTATIQSASASVGIVQAMGAQGVLTLAQAAPMIYGMDIGACISAILASFGAKREAKRSAFLAVIFSTLGAIIFVVASQFIPFETWIANLTPGEPMRQIANLNTIFNVVSMMILLPLSDFMVKIAEKIIPDGPEEGTEMRLLHIDQHAFGAVSIGEAQVDAEVSRMFHLARENLSSAMELLLGEKDHDPQELENNEELIDYLNKEITHCLVRLNAMELSRKDALRLSGMYHVLSDIERIGDHAINMVGYHKSFLERNLDFSDTAKQELRTLTDEVLVVVDSAYDLFIGKKGVTLQQVEIAEQQVDDRVDEWEVTHIRRLNSGLCNADAALLYSEVLTDLERVSDHALNIGQAAEYHR